MIKFNIDKVQEELDGKYNLVHLIVNRVGRLRAGVEARVDKRSREKEIVLAIREVDESDLQYEVIEDSKGRKDVSLSEVVIDANRA